MQLHTNPKEHFLQNATSFVQVHESLVDNNSFASVAKGISQRQGSISQRQGSISKGQSSISKGQSSISQSMFSKHPSQSLQCHGRQA
jgi:hypothetical protein